MQITPLTTQDTFAPKFTPLPGSNTDYLFSTIKYDIEVKYGSSVFYAPSFYYVEAKNKQGAVIWSGGKRLFLDSLFQSDFISDKFDKLILCEVHDTGDSSSLQIVLVDLKTGEEKYLTDIGSHDNYGHFQSFDGVYYWDGKDIRVIDFETNERYVLYSLLQENFANIKAWRPCPIAGCVVVLTDAQQNNVSLFNFREKKIVEQLTLLLDKADNINLFMTNEPDKNRVIISADFANRDANGILKPLKTERYKIEF